MNNSLPHKSVIGTDPITKGTFVVEWASMWYDDDTDSGEFSPTKVQAKFVITQTDSQENPLFKIAKESPLRLQGLLANVDFGTEKRFIRIETISNYTIYPKMNDEESVDLNVIFVFLDNLGYLENIIDYKDTNLL